MTVPPDAIQYSMSVDDRRRELSPEEARWVDWVQNRVFADIDNRFWAKTKNEPAKDPTRVKKGPFTVIANDHGAHNGVNILTEDRDLALVLRARYRDDEIAGGYNVTVTELEPEGVGKLYEVDIYTEEMTISRADVYNTVVSDVPAREI